MKEKFSIGELARLFDITPETLRHYDRISLFNAEVNPSNKYRYYNIRSMFKLSRILFLKNLEFSLTEINQYMRDKNTSYLNQMLKNKEEEIDHKINQLQNLKNKIQSKRELLKSVESELNLVKVKSIPLRHGLFLETNKLKDEFEIKQAFKKSEPYLKFSSWFIEGQIYTSLSKEMINKGVFNKIRYFIEIESVDIKLLEQMEIMPSTEYACLIVIGPYSEMPKHYRKLINWIKENNYSITGDSIEKNIVDYDFSDYEEEYVSEIQIPIKKISLKN